MAEQWQCACGFRVVRILWTEDRAPHHALDLPLGPLCIDPDDYIDRYDLPISREEALQVASELNDEILATWMGRTWHAVFEVGELSQCYGQVEDDGMGNYTEDWTITRPVSLIVPTVQEVMHLCATS